MKKTLLLLILMVSFIQLHAQKRTTESAFYHLIIEPPQQVDENSRRYKPVLETPLNTLTDYAREQALVGIDEKDEVEQRKALQKARKASLPRMANNLLSFREPQFVAVKDKQDFTVKLTTSELHISYIAPNIAKLKNNEDIAARYSFLATLEITDKDGKVLLKEEVNRPAEEQVITKGILFFEPKYFLKMKMYARNEKKKRKFLNQLFEKYERDILVESMERARALMNEEFCTGHYTVLLDISAAKKKFDYSQLEQVQEQVSEALEFMASSRKKKHITNEQVGERMQKAVKIWQQELAQLEATNKEARINDKIADGLRVNLSIAHIWFKEFDKAMEYLDQVEDSKPENGLGSVQSFKDKAQKLRKTLEEVIENQERVRIDNRSQEQQD